MGKCAIGGSVKCVSAKLDKFCSSNVQFFCILVCVPFAFVLVKFDLIVETLDTSSVSISIPKISLDFDLHPGVVALD